MSTINVGIVGLRQGRTHARVFQLLEETCVVAIADTDEAVLQRVGNELGVDARYDGIEQLLDDPAVQMVVVATPDHLHGQHVIAALESGRHVLSEIPMATTVEECRRIFELTLDGNLKYHLGNQVRYAHCLQDIHAQIQSGDLGEIFYGEGEYLHDMEDILTWAHPKTWRTEPVNPQTTLLGGGPHALDTLRWLMDVRFSSVQAYHAGGSHLGMPVHTTVALARAESGAVAKITVSYGMVRPYCLYYSVYGTEGSFERTRDQGGSNEDTINLQAHRRSGRSRKMTQVQLPNFANPPIARRLAGASLGHGTMEYEQAAGFVSAILRDSEPLIGPREALDSTLPLICALESAANGGGLIEIPTLV